MEPLRANTLRMTIGAFIGAVIAIAIAPLIKPLFHAPMDGVGVISLTKYPKGWDYAVIALLALFSAAGATLCGGGLQPAHREPGGLKPAATGAVATWTCTAIVFVLLLFAYDHPYSFMDHFHEGEHLTPASVLRDGGHPYRDIFFLHGFATDGGLDTLVLGNPPSPLNARRLITVLNAATMALLVPIAAELTASAAGMIIGVLLSLCAVAAGLVPLFPHFRVLPLLIATWLLLRGRLKTALFVSTLAILWSLEVGLYATVVAFAYGAFTQYRDRKFWIVAAGAILAPFVVLVVLRADLHHFVQDSFVYIPRASDPTSSLPAPPLPTFALAFLKSEAVHYYAPPVFFGLLLAIAAARRDKRALIVAAMSLMLLRTAAGRVSWSHTRFAVPLLGIALVAFVLEPAACGRKVWRLVVLALLIVPIGLYFEVVPNVVAGAKYVAEWRARQRHDGLAPYPMPQGRRLYTYAENAADLKALMDVTRDIPPHAPMFDLSGERALYYFLDRPPATRCPDLFMMSYPPLEREALDELARNPPAFVVLEGLPPLANFDGIPNRQRVPHVAAWIDEHYPVRKKAGRFLVGFAN